MQSGCQGIARLSSRKYQTLSQKIFVHLLFSSALTTSFFNSGFKSGNSLFLFAMRFEALWKNLTNDINEVRSENTWMPDSTGRLKP